MTNVDYLRWMGTAAWTCGLAIPRKSRELSLVPGISPRRVSIRCAGGCAYELPAIEREHTGVQWLLGGSPQDENELDYVYHQDIHVTRHPATDSTFTVVDFSDTANGLDSSRQNGAYSPESSLAASHRMSVTAVGESLPTHIPNWNVAEPLGLLALAVREFFTGARVRELTRDYVLRAAGEHQQPSGGLAYGRLAYSVASATTEEPGITLHVLAEDPLFTPAVLEHLVDRAADFASAFASSVDCRAVFYNIRRHPVFPATVHEPDAVDTPVILYRIPLAADLLPMTPLWDYPASIPLVLHRDPESGAIERRPFTPRSSLVDRSIHCGGYLDTASVIADLQREISAVDPASLAAQTTPAMVWESLTTWGMSKDSRPTSSVRAIHPNVVLPVGNSITRPLVTMKVDETAPPGTVAHDVCDALEALGVDPSIDFPLEVVPAAVGSFSDDGIADNDCSDNPSTCPTGEPHPTALPSLWPRALGARRWAATDVALAHAAVRHAVHGRLPHGASWLGVRHSRSTTVTAEHHLSVAVAYAPAGPQKTNDAQCAVSSEDLACTVEATLTTNFRSAQIVCEVVDAREISDAREWVTAAGYHPVWGALPASMQLERYSSTRSFGSQG